MVGIDEIHAACGVNFIDTYHRSGLYRLALPSGIGLEGAGVVEAVGAGVSHVLPGDRVAYAGGAVGAYATERVLPAAVLLKLPDAIGFDITASIMLGGETILFHAAAGGVGLIACQWARALGITMIGTVGSDDKARLAKAHGCTHVINYKTENFVERVRELTGGRGVPVVYDGVGKDTFTGSLDCLAARGLMVSYGNASGAVPPFALTELASRGSLYITRPSLFHYTAERADYEAMGAELFKIVESGKVKIEVHHRYPLADAAQAHRDLEARRTTGSSILVP
jgi:NADPH:quinone reductase